MVVVVDDLNMDGLDYIPFISYSYRYRKDKKGGEMMDAVYLLRLLTEAKTLLSTITPQLDQAFRFGRAEGCIDVAVIHIESSLPKMMEADHGQTIK